MKRRGSKVRSAWWVGVLAAASALTLAGCMTQSTLHVIGLPSIGISVPLRLTACTTSGSCIAVGTTGSSTTPSSVGEYRESNGVWNSLAVPAAPSSLITSASCLSTQCLIGGLSPTGNLLWTYNASSQSVIPLDTLRAGQGIRSLSCFGISSCAAIVAGGVDAASTISFSADAGTSWSTPVALTWSKGDTVSALTCTSSLDCIATATTGTNSVVVERSRDGGNTWVSRATRVAWTNLTWLSCHGLVCNALATTSSKTYVVRTKNFGRTWLENSLPAQGNALACASINKCVVVGQKRNDSPWFATSDDLQLTVATLKYVPSPLLAVACAKTVCTALGVSTVLAYRF